MLNLGAYQLLPQNRYCYLACHVNLDVSVTRLLAVAGAVAV